MKTLKNRWVLIIHGGAKEIAPEAEESNRAGLLDAVRAGSRVLEAGGTAVDACEAAVRVLETLPVFTGVAIGYLLITLTAGALLQVIERKVAIAR